MKFTSSSDYISRRSPAAGTAGIVATSQPAATAAGIRALEAGGTAADAAVAAAAALGLCQPCSTGLGGDCFCLYFEAESGKITALNGSGRTAGALDLAAARKVSTGRRLPVLHPYTVTVPGAPAAWTGLHERFGRLALGRVLEPVVRLARDGFPVVPLTAKWWQGGAEKQLSRHRHGAELMIDGRGPQPGEVFRNPGMAGVLETMAAEGSAPFYTGGIARRIVEAVREEGGLLTEEDLASHRNEWVLPLSAEYGGVRLWECPPNGQGLAALIALNILKNLKQPLSDLPPYLRFHYTIEAMRLAFADAALWVADPGPAFNEESGFSENASGARGGRGRSAYTGAGPRGGTRGEAVSPLSGRGGTAASARGEGAGSRSAETVFQSAGLPVGDLLSDAYGAERAALIRPDRRCEPRPGIRLSDFFSGSDTVYFCCTDAEGNGCSFINSNFAGFGTGIVPEGCGYSLQNRGHGLVLEEGHPNCIAPRKRPYHTIIPALATREADGSLFALLGVMGGMMQPQGHLQVFLSLVEDGLDPQAALDRPRFQISGGSTDGSIPVPVEGREELLLEEGFGSYPADGGQAAGDRSAADARSAGPDNGGAGGDGTAGSEGAAALREALLRLGHPIRMVSGSARSAFGLGQVILRTPGGMYWGGSDPRGDGCAAARLP